MKQRKRLQHSDKRMDQSSLREWGRGPRLCESFLLIPTDGHVSGGVSKSPEGSVFFFFLRLLCFIVFFFFFFNFCFILEYSWLTGVSQVAQY